MFDEGLEECKKIGTKIPPSQNLKNSVKNLTFTVYIRQYNC